MLFYFIVIIHEKDCLVKKKFIKPLLLYGEKSSFVIVSLSLRGNEVGAAIPRPTVIARQRKLPRQSLSSKGLLRLRS